MSESNYKPAQNNIDDGMFRVAFDTAAIVMIGLSPNHEILEFNREAEHLYGISRDEVLGKDYFQLFLPKEVWVDVASDIKKVLAGEPTKDFENIIRRKDGEERLLSWYVSRFLDQQEEPQGIMAVGYDITEQRAGEEQRKSYELYQITIENISDTVIITDDEGVFIYVCSNIDVIFGYSAEEVLTFGKIETILGRTPFEFSELREKGEISNIEVPIVNKSGGHRFLLVNVKKVDIFGGTVLYSCRDITERKKAQERERKSHHLLEQMYAKEKGIADILQETLLTVPERIEGIDFSHLYRSATVEIGKVGGDFYDLFELEDDKVAIVIGDVSGKGLEAASLTSLVKNTIKAYSYQQSSPAKVVAMTNDVVIKTSAQSTFVTVFFGILDKDSGVFTYSSAGHPAPILRSKTSKTSSLRTGAPVIGVFPDLNYVDNVEVLKQGDILVLYTDGVVEARCKKDLYGDERLIKFIKGLKRPKIKEIPKLILDEIIGYSNHILTDDLALLAVSL